jgi:hypothetical protein
MARTAKLFKNIKSLDTVLSVVDVISITESEIIVTIGDENKTFTKRSGDVFVLDGEKKDRGYVIALIAEEGKEVVTASAPTKDTAKTTAPESKPESAPKAKKEENPNSKATRCRLMVAEMTAGGKTRKEIMARIQTELSLKPVAASTYFYNSKKALGLPNLGRQKAVLTTESKKPDMTEGYQEELKQAA